VQVALYEKSASCDTFGLYVVWWGDMCVYCVHVCIHACVQDKVQLNSYEPSNEQMHHMKVGIDVTAFSRTIVISNI